MENDEGFLIGALLRIPAEMLAQEMERRIAQQDEFGDLRPIHDAVFLYLPPEGCRLTELAQRARMTRQAMSYLVDYLIDHTYIERVPDPSDGRAQILRRTERGWEYHRMVKQFVQEIQQTWAQELGEAEMRQLLVLLRRLVRDVLKVGYEGSLSALSNPPES